ncbi:28S ribosomal protein S16 [Operophtera brumata]|uniref:28S ribosomal protein S16 n=1 Tax=Operophtera brumata TaxID=104452 RepID=A0A0L7L5Y2_OPEBR|nr:28S ribosomal protein S16 [Operophtera brumata]
MSIVLPPASGTGRYFAKAAKSIRLVRQGCTNRPFFHISVTHVMFCSWYEEVSPVNSSPMKPRLGSRRTQLI